MRIHLASDQRALLSAVAGFLGEHHVQAWATGGFLRDSLLGLPTRDLDVTLDADPLGLGRGLAGVIDAHFVVLDEGRRHVRLAPRTGVGSVDLTPLRAESIGEDLRLRDFTVNAMAGEIGAVARGDFDLIDPNGGLADLRVGILRAISEQCLRDDPLRLLRGARIANELTFHVDGDTAAMIRRSAHLVTEAAAERQRDELVRIFGTDRAAAGIRLLDDLKLFSHVFPELEVMRGVEQPKEHSFDVFEHSLAALEALDFLLAEEQPVDSPQRDLWGDLWSALDWCDGLRERFGEESGSGMSRKALLKLCGLLHDVGKPGTKTFEPNGRMRFFGHSEMGAEIAARLMRRLRFSASEVRDVSAMIEAHLRPIQLGQSPGGRPSKRAIYKFFRYTGDAGIDTLFLSLADHLGTAGPRVSVDGFHRHVALTSYILDVRFRQAEIVAPPKLVDGDDLCAVLGIEPGPLVGRLLEAVREARAAGEVETRDEALEFARRELGRISRAAE
jgi:putative nucleotidyltransferase with HDIG domain